MAAIYEAAEQGDIAEVERLLQADPDCLNQQGRGGWTPLHWAAAGGHADVVKLLLSKGADDTIRDRQGYSAMYWAGHYHDEAEVTQILGRRWKDRVKQEIAHRETVEAEEKRQWQIASLHEAAQHGDVQRILQLLQTSPELVNVTRDAIFGTTLLMQAIRRGHIDVVHVLIGKGADTEARTMSDKSALSLAAEAGHAAIVNILIEHGARLDTLCSQSRTPLHHGSRSSSPSTVQALIDAGAGVNVQDERLRSPLHLAVQKSPGKGIVGYGVHAWVDAPHTRPISNDDIHSRQIQIVRSLLAGGADVTLRDYKGRTPLHVAAENKLEAVVRLLLDAGADVLARDGEDKTPLDLAVSQGHLAVAQLLQA